MAPPINDNFADRVVITGATGTEGPYTIDDATMESGEPTGTGLPSVEQTIWFEWTAPASKTTVIDLNSSTVDDTTLSVWTGSTLATLTHVASNDDIFHAGGNLRSRVTFAATAGTTYMIQAGTFLASATGDQNLFWAQSAYNDDFADRLVLTGGSGDSPPIGIDDATTETGEPAGSALFTLNQTLWYEWVAPTTGAYFFHSELSDPIDTTLTVWTGSSLGTLVEVASDDDSGSVGNTSRVDFAATSGTSYKIQLGTYGGGETGLAQITWGLSGPPANDDFADATDLGSASTDSIIDGSLGFATTETGEPTGSNLTGGLHHTVWFKWTPAADMTVQFTASGAPVTLAVWTGSSLGTLVEVESSAGSGTAADVTFDATTGTVYWIQVGTQGSGDSGTAVLHWEAIADWTLTGSTHSVTLDQANVPHTVSITLTTTHDVDLHVTQSNLGTVKVVYTPYKPSGTYDATTTWTITVQTGVISPVSPGATPTLNFVATDGVVTQNWLVQIFIVNTHPHPRPREALYDITVLSNTLVNGGLRDYTGGTGHPVVWNSVSGPNRLCGAIQHGDSPYFWWMDGTPSEPGVTLDTKIGVARNLHGTWQYLGSPFWVGRNDTAYSVQSDTHGLTDEITGIYEGSVRLVSDGTYLYCVALIRVRDMDAFDLDALGLHDSWLDPDDAGTLQCWKLACMRYEDGIGGDAYWLDYGWDQARYYNYRAGWIPEEHDFPFYDPPFPEEGWTLHSSGSYTAEGYISATKATFACASEAEVGTVHGCWFEEGIPRDLDVPILCINEWTDPDAWFPASHITWHVGANYDFRAAFHSCRFTGPGMVESGNTTTHWDELRRYWDGMCAELPNYLVSYPFRDAIQWTIANDGGRPLMLLEWQQHDSEGVFEVIQDVRDLVTGDVIQSTNPASLWSGDTPLVPSEGLLGTPGIMTVDDPTSGGISYSQWIEHGYNWVTFQAVNYPHATSPNIAPAFAEDFDPSIGVGVWGVVYNLSDFYDFGVLLGARAVALGAMHVIVDAEFCLEGTRPGGAQPIIDGLVASGWTGPVHLSTLGSPSDPMAFDFEMDFQSFLDTGGGVLPQSYSNETPDYDAANCAAYWQRLGVPSDSLNYTIGLYGGAAGRLSGGEYVPLLEGAGCGTNFSIFLGETATSNDLEELDILSQVVFEPSLPVGTDATPPDTALPWHLLWDEEVGFYYTLTYELDWWTPFPGDYHPLRVITLTADGLTWGKLFRAGKDVSKVGAGVPFSVDTFKALGFPIVLDVQGTTGHVYIWGGQAGPNADDWNRVVYGWNPCPTPGPKSTVGWGEYRLGNVSPHYPNPTMATDYHPIDGYQNMVPPIGNEAATYNRSDADHTAVKIGDSVYGITNEHGHFWAGHTGWDTYEFDYDYRVYQFIIGANLDTQTCPVLVSSPGPISEGAHIWKLYSVE